jgi:hypothetical protein
VVYTPDLTQLHLSCPEAIMNPALLPDGLHFANDAP